MNPCAPTGPPPRHRLAYTLTALITVAVFGPYTPLPGIRTEQAAVYGTLLAGLVLCVWIRVRPTPAAALILALLATETTIAVLGWKLPGPPVPGFAPGSPIAGLDNLLLPIAVVTVALMMASGGADPDRMLRIVCTILVAAMCVNTALAFWSSHQDLTWLLGSFWDKEVSTHTTALRTAAHGRFTGLLNLPAEAGAMYAMATLAAIYLYRDRPLKMGVTATMLIIGGVLAISKIFLLVGLPIAAWQAIRVTGPRLRRWIVLTTAGVFTTGAIRSGMILNADGDEFLGRLLRPDDTGQSAVGLYTAGRFDGTSGLQEVIDAVLDASPWFGAGARGLVAAYDTAWVEALVVAGLAGAAIYTAVLVVLVAAWAGRRGTPQATFAGALLAVVVGASFGFPALTANRVATVAWLLLTLLLLVPRKDRPEPAAD